MQSEDRRRKSPQYHLPIGGSWQRVSERYMVEELMEESLDDYLELDDLIYRYQMNPLAFALPHGRKRKDRHKNDGIAFVNDRRSGLMTVTAGSQFGKAQPLTAKIQTPTGEVCMGSLVVGDTVFGGDGLPCEVTGVFEQGLKPCYAVTFENKSSTECCGEHLWYATIGSRDDAWKRTGVFLSLIHI